jgi:hypothetical protein
VTSRIAIALLAAAAAGAYADPIRLALHEDVAIARAPVFYRLPVVSRSLDDQLASLLSRAHRFARRLPHPRILPRGVYPFFRVEHLADEKRDTAPRVILFGLRFAPQ